MAVHRPSTTEELCEAVRAALASGTTLEVVGSGSRKDFGRPVEAEAVLDLSAFSGIRVYEPHELVLTVGAATPIAEIEALLAGENQRLAFEPPDLGPLWGLPAGQGTLGGALSVGLGGSGRVTLGAPRDHFLGFKAVNGFGEAFAAGGRVVKNVTGYDLPKLMAGAFGTLGLMTEVTIKVMPRPECSVTLAALGLDEPAGLSFLRQVLAGPYQATGAAYLPQDGAALSLALVRLDGHPAAVASMGTEIILPLKKVMDVSERAKELWVAIGSGTAFVGTDGPVWRLSIPPSKAAAVGAGLRAIGVERLYYDWAGAAVWLEAPNTDEAGAAGVRQVLRDVAGEGHATLMRAPAAIRAAVDPFEPQAPALAALTARVKGQFDPQGLFNPGRMYPGV